MLCIICSGGDFSQLLYIYIYLNSEVFVYFMYYFFHWSQKYVTTVQSRWNISLFQAFIW